MNQQRLTRVISILGYLSPHSQVTVHDLAAQYGTSEKTIQRDVEVLQDAKLGVYIDDATIKIHREGYKKIKQWMSGE